MTTPLPKTIAQYLDLILHTARGVGAMHAHLAKNLLVKSG